jgi:hypothetical protein
LEIEKQSTVGRGVSDVRNLENEEAKARYRAVKIKPQWVVTPEKQKTNTQWQCPLSQDFDLTSNFFNRVGEKVK